MIQKDRGDSLVEVIIATVIMALLGSAIVGTIAMAQPLSERFNQTGVALTKLSAAAQQIQLATFKDCTAANTPSYAFTAGATPAATGTTIANGDHCSNQRSKRHRHGRIHNTRVDPMH